MRRRVSLVAVIAAVLAACGPPSTDDDPIDSANKRWNSVRTYVDRLARAPERVRADARSIVCRALGAELRRALERRAGGRAGPDCQFLDRIALLNGKTRLGALEGTKEAEASGPQRVTARVRAEGEGRTRSVPVELTHSNPGNWEITGLDDLP